MQRVYTIERQLRTTGLGLSLPSAAKLISHLRCESASLLRVSYPSLQAARLAALSYVGCMWVACGLHVCCHSVACAARKLPERLFWCGFTPTVSSVTALQAERCLAQLLRIVRPTGSFMRASALQSARVDTDRDGRTARAALPARAPRRPCCSASHCCLRASAAAQRRGKAARRLYAEAAKEAQA